MNEPSSGRRAARTRWEGGCLPRVAIIDDQLGVCDLLRGHRGYEGQERKFRAERRAYCERFSLIEVGEEGAADAVAEAVFHPGLKWAGEDVLELDVPGVMDWLDGLVQSEAGPPALVIVDLVFFYSYLDPETGEFMLRAPRHGLETILPAIRERYGEDRSTPDRHWTALPAVVISDWEKEDIDAAVRSAGARGMIQKQSPEGGRERLREYILAHGLLEDERGILLGRSIPFLNALAAARRAARGRSVLVYGETGTGKELLARYIHDHSPRADGPYVVFHAAGRSDELQEDELFGHWKGAFTGATADRAGLLEEANGGTLFVDEVGDVHLRVQNALMRPLQERVTSRMGRPPSEDAAAVHLDLLFVFATNKDLGALVQAGRFKPDLLDRLNETTVRLPPLRERPGDVEYLAPILLQQVAREMSWLPGGMEYRLDPAAVASLARMEFREGNIRELRRLLANAILSNPAEEVLREADFATARRGAAAGAAGGERAETGGGTGALAEAGPAALLVELPSIDVSRLTVGELADLCATARGAAPAVLAWLLEISLRAAQLEGRRGLTGVMEHFWGLDALTSQQAGRLLARLLNVENRSGSVLEAVRSRTGLREHPWLRRFLDEKEKGRR